MRRVFVFLVLSVLASSVSAETWRKLGTDAQGVTAYFQGSSFKKAGSLRYYSMKYVMPEPDATGMIYNIRSEVIDCDRATIRLLNIAGYRANDTLIASVPMNEEPREAPPGSNGGEMVRGMCGI